MPNLKVTVLFYETRDGEVTERDEVVDQVSQALIQGKHKVSLLGINKDLHELLVRLEELKPDIVFNLCETFAGQDIFEMHITAVLNMLGQRFTGTGPVGMALRQDKALTKKLLRFYGVNCSSYAIFDKTNLEFAGHMRFPLFVKPLRGDASLCVDEFSLVTDYNKLIERVNLIQEELRDAALVEEYIEGREFYASVLGNSPAEVLPLVEMDFSRLAPGHPQIYGWQAKFDASSIQYDGTNAILEKDLTGETRSRIIKAAREASHAVQINDYARVDIRLAPDGTPFIIEVNANPYLERTSEFAQAAHEAGLDYPALINKILEVSWKRWELGALRKKPGRLTRTAIRKRDGKVVPSCLRFP